MCINKMTVIGEMVEEQQSGIVIVRKGKESWQYMPMQWDGKMGVFAAVCKQ